MPADVAPSLHTRHRPGRPRPGDRRGHLRHRMVGVRRQSHGLARHRRRRVPHPRRRGADRLVPDAHHRQAGPGPGHRRAAVRRDLGEVGASPAGPRQRSANRRLCRCASPPSTAITDRRRRSRPRRSPRCAASITSVPGLAAVTVLATEGDQPPCPSCSSGRRSASSSPAGWARSCSSANSSADRRRRGGISCVVGPSSAVPPAPRRGAPRPCCGTRDPRRRAPSRRRFRRPPGTTPRARPRTSCGWRCAVSRLPLKST